MKVTEAQLAQLNNGNVIGPQLRITEQLERKDYLALNKVIEAMGGKWNRTRKAHLFDSAEALADALESVFNTGEVTTRQDMGYFPTPAAVQAQMINAIPDGLRAGCIHVLEPSSGDGALVKALRAACPDATIVGIEVDEGRCNLSSALTDLQIKADFLEVEPDEFSGFDLIFMNPPFSKSHDAKHILHARRFLKEGGRLISVASAGVWFRTTGAYAELGALINENGDALMLPPDSFKESGTKVNTALVVLDA